MKTFATILVLLALGVPAFAAESVPPSLPLQLSSPSCPSATAGMALSSQASVLPAELTAKPLPRAADLELLFRLGSEGQSCAVFCSEVCGGCCYYGFRGPGTCDCC
jgi:hypothetical protein